MKRMMKKIIRRVIVLLLLCIATSVQPAVAAQTKLVPLKKLERYQYFRKYMSDKELDAAYKKETKHYNDPYGYLVKGVASCAGCARTTGFCLNMLGIHYTHVNEGKYSHQWARVKVGNEYWICDAYGLYCGPEPAVNKHPYLR